MSDNNPDNSQDGEKSGTKLVPILIIIAIGIPVLIELMTLFNLINVHLVTKDQNDTAKGSDQITEVRKWVQGDTLFAKSQSAVTIERMQVQVSPRHWNFDLVFTKTDSAARQEPDIVVDSLKLKSGKVMVVNDDHNSNTPRANSAQIKYDWELPNGDIPTILFINSPQALAGDSTNAAARQLKLGNIPVRYDRAN